MQIGHYVNRKIDTEIRHLFLNIPNGRREVTAPFWVHKYEWKESEPFSLEKKNLHLCHMVRVPLHQST